MYKALQVKNLHSTSLRQLEGASGAALHFAEYVRVPGAGIAEPGCRALQGMGRGTLAVYAYVL